jgi:hypothetical protein
MIKKDTTVSLYMHIIFILCGSVFSLSTAYGTELIIQRTDASKQQIIIYDWNYKTRLFFRGKDKDEFSLTYNYLGGTRPSEVRCENGETKITHEGNEFDIDIRQYNNCKAIETLIKMATSTCPIVMTLNSRLGRVDRILMTCFVTNAK